MKKKIFGGVAAIAIAAIVFTVTAYGGDTSTGSISTGKDGGGVTCDNINGYRQFSNMGGGYGAYDCCYVWRNGEGKKDCKAN
jgi:hypothetical protein